MLFACIFVNLSLVENLALQDRAKLRLYTISSAVWHLIVSGILETTKSLLVFENSASVEQAFLLVIFKEVDIFIPLNFEQVILGHLLAFESHHHINEFLVVWYVISTKVSDVLDEVLEDR